MNIRGFLNARQLVVVLASGGFVGISAAIDYVVRHPEMVNAALGPFMASLVTSALVGAWSAYSGRPVEDVAKEVADQVFGEDPK